MISSLYFSGCIDVAAADIFSINYASKVIIPEGNGITILSPYAEVQGEKRRAYAYISLTELNSNSPLIKQLPREIVVSENTAWSSYLVQIDHKEWLAIIEKELELILQQGYQHVFIDTVDGVETLCQKTPDKCKSYRESACMLIQRIRKRMSGNLIINRGFLIYPDIKKIVQGMLIESFFYGKKKDRYERRTGEEMEWLKTWVERLRNDNKIVLTVDYAENLAVAEKVELQKKARQLGIMWRLDHESLQY
jgi:uncharacterized protein (TIGR01370 family)